MSDAKHTPPGDRSFRASLLRSAAGALALVVLMAVVFGAIGMLGREDDDPVADDEPSVTEPEEPADVEVDDAEGEPQADAPDLADEDGTDEPEAPEAGDEGEEPAEPDDDAAEPAPDDRQFDPADVSVQVLDGYGADGGAAADAVAATLREEGYRVVAQNPAVAYEVTTVLWTAGYEEQARQVAAEIDAPEVREQPGNLSTGVQVHVVVGADRG